MKKEGAYRFKGAGRVSAAIDANKVGERFEKIAEKHSGRLTASAIVKDAQKKSSPMHDYFDWDRDAAAQEHWLTQARELMRYLVYELETVPGDSTITRAYESVVMEAEPAYMHIVDVMNDPESRAQVVARALRDFQELRQRHAQLKELASIFASIDRFAA